MLTKTLAAEEGKSGIRVNSVNPGIIDTPIHEMSGFPKDQLDRSMEIHKKVIGRNGTPEEVANAIVFLASKEASFITGSLLSVDGGKNCYQRI